MVKRNFFTLLALSFFAQPFFAQNDPVLFTVENTPVHRSEFEYIYSKTNGPTADFSEASLQEYLDLYIKFKLKVQKAKEMRLDTIQSLQQELDGYRRQLADSYLIDREVTEKLVEEAFTRSRQDVNISHIMVNVPDTAPAEADQKAKEKALEAKRELDKGTGFDAVAAKYSDDKSVQKNKGQIGWVTALFPNGFYALETAAYNATVGKATDPIRTSAGYHILMVNERRPARGEVEVAHILVRATKGGDPIKERLKMDEAYQKLQSGSDWDQVCSEYSDDKLTADKGGYLGVFGINRYEKTFEDAAFGLQKDGDYTRPVETTIGWHLIKRIGRKSDQTIHQMKSKLEADLKKDARFELAKKAMVERIKRESNFKENRTTLNKLVATLEQDTAKTFLTYKWKAPEKPATEELFSFGKSNSTTLGDFEGYLQRASRQRQQAAGKGIPAIVDELYTDFVGENALKFEEQQLEVKYPEFKSLMREYEEGVMLFEVTKMEVWDKASSDTVGLEKFYEANKTKYQWAERAVVSQYSLLEKELPKSNQLREFARTHDPKEVLAKFNVDSAAIVFVQPKTFEKGRNEVLDKMTWAVGELSAPEISKRDKSFNFFKIEEILKPSQKSLKEARGYVVADYQDFLEKEWQRILRDEYKVKVEQKVFKEMVKKG